MEMAIKDQDPTSITTALLTLLNVSATRAGKRKVQEEVFVPAEKLNKRKSARISETASTPETDVEMHEDNVPETVETVQEEGNDASDTRGSCLYLYKHFRLTYT